MTQRSKVAIVYGFAEDTWQGKAFCKALEQRGFTLVKSYQEADIIITHSGGCMYNFALRPEQLLVMIAPIYWPGRSRLRRFTHKALQDIGRCFTGGRPLYRLNRLAHNLFFMVVQPKKTWFMVTRARTFNLEAAISGKNRTVLIRNQKDPWCTPKFGGLGATHPNVTTHELPGDHDDCWMYPEMYLEIIESCKP